jgi:hypothetical protein
MKFPDKCPECFWNDASLENWKTFETKNGVDRDKKLKEIKNKKCVECMNASNFLQVLKCQKCRVRIDIQVEIDYCGLCENCWTKENSQQ